MENQLMQTNKIDQNEKQDSKELIVINKTKTHNKIKEIIKTIKIYLAYFKIKFLNEIQYKIAAIAGVLTQFTWGAMYIMLYTAFMKNETVNDYSISQLCSYIWLQQAFYSLFNVWSLDKDILEQCTNGNISMELVKPIDLYSIWHAKTFGMKLARMSLRAVPIFILCSMPFLGKFRLIFPTNILTFIATVITLILTILLILSYIMIMYVCIIKTMTSRGLQTSFHLLMEFGSGGLIPIPFMPEWLINILKFTPFYYMQNVTFNIYNGYISNPIEIAKIILLQIVWLCIFTFIGKKLIKKQISNIVIQGG